MKVILILIVILFLFLTIRRFVHLFFMNLAIGRKTLKIRQYKKAKELSPLHTERQVDEWLKTQEYQRIKIKGSYDGIGLFGHYLPAKEAKRTLILFHGWRSEFKIDFSGMAEALHHHGCNLLFAEQRAHGMSEGKYIGLGVLERFDCVDWLEFVKNREPNLPIYLAGQSMGASTVLMASGQDLPGEVMGIIAECGFTSAYEMVERVAKSLHLKPKTVGHVNRICYKKAGFDLNEYTTLKAMEACRTPVLFVHGTADTFVPSEMTMQNYHACKSRKKLLLIEGATHCNSFAHDTETYLKTICTFFNWKIIPQAKAELDI